MKKILIAMLIFSNLWIWQMAFADTGNCWDIDKEKLDNSTISQLLWNCQPKWAIDWTQGNVIAEVGGITLSSSDNKWYEIENAKWKITAITDKLIILATIIAIWGLVYSGFLFTTAYWNNDKIKNAKEWIKWSLIWLLLALISQQLVNAVINLIYWISG
ncbi:MAG: hypothetical protein ACD_2C00163G0003 [uncultured bacterium (gcode 4)]|uniref:Uncharacterized protein n=1 Tax=uncultured bacterium (gcode 4) TaxID=1234023 RepID=K2G2Q5_9BACT|nr:MAG: hypothetical protein ACD_2C00163G0003 [uncultured bacterium (gcode 4)]